MKGFIYYPQSYLNLLLIREIEKQQESENKIILALLKKGAEANSFDDLGHSALHKAAGYNNPDVVQILLNHGANPHNPDQDMETPLHWAASMGQYENILLLAHAGADINVKGRYGVPADVAESEGFEFVSEKLREIMAAQNPQQKIKEEIMKLGLRKYIQ